MKYKYCNAEIDLDVHLFLIVKKRIDSYPHRLYNTQTYYL